MSPPTASDKQDTRAFPTTADENVACGCAARLLISAPSERGVETIARRIHEGGPRAHRPFLHLSARDLPVEPEALQEYCGRVLDRTAGGSLLIDAVETMPPSVQDALIELLDALELARKPSDAVRLIASTTVSLLDRVADGTFSAQLFYRLNTIHLVSAGGGVHVTGPADSRDGRVGDPAAPKPPR